MNKNNTIKDLVYSSVVNSVSGDAAALISCHARYGVIEEIYTYITTSMYEAITQSIHSYLFRHEFE